MKTQKQNTIVKSEGKFFWEVESRRKGQFFLFVHNSPPGLIFTSSIKKGHPHL